MTRSKRATRILLIALSAIWVCVVILGMAMLARYKQTPGKAADAPAMFPAGTQIQPAAGLPTVVMLAHPKCPCTRASLSELAKLSERIRQHASIHVLFTRPSDAPAGWEQSDLWRQALAIPGVNVIADPGGADARMFGSFTSGQVLVYDEQGQLKYRGGITAARGHEGDNAGSDRVLALVTSDASVRANAPVFGCGLQDEAEESARQ